MPNDTRQITEAEDIEKRIDKIQELLLDIGGYVDIAGSIGENLNTKYFEHPSHYKAFQAVYAHLVITTEKAEKEMKEMKIILLRRGKTEPQ